MSKDPQKEGWGFPPNSRKAHYFVNSKSLCGKWLWLSNKLDPAGETSPDDCALCTRRLKKHQVPTEKKR